MAVDSKSRYRGRCCTIHLQQGRTGSQQPVRWKFCWLAQRGEFLAFSYFLGAEVYV